MLEIIIDQFQHEDKFWVHNLITVEKVEKRGENFVSLYINSCIHKYLDIHVSYINQGGKTFTALDFIWINPEYEDREGKWDDASKKQMFEIKIENFHYGNHHIVPLKLGYRIDFYNLPKECEVLDHKEVIMIDD